MAVIRFTRLAGDGNDAVELNECRQFPIGPQVFLGPALNPSSLSAIDETMLSVYYRTPDLRWIQGMGGLEQCRRGGEGYLEKHPVMVARDFLFFGVRLPPELEPWRHDATEGFENWLKRQGPGIAGSKDARDGTLDAYRKSMLSAASKAPASTATRKRGPRDKGYDGKCRRVYLGYLERKETPPSLTAIAKEVGCSRSTACRAIKKWEETRKGYAKEGLRSRHENR
jgi:hypothetical protein